ncbi:MAG: IMP cyclohydrolase [Lachnospiraceae bacterium]|nr:IMP cyclohydrolase [Lachnospiraceae bacterium]
MKTAAQEAGSTAYPGRGIILGCSEDGKEAVIAYFIMGRSTNSRNRIFAPEGEGIRTEAFDPSLLEDPSLIIYAPVRVLGDTTIVTNGDQTDTVYDGLKKGLTFEQSLRSRCFEPDAPNYTPRISGAVYRTKGAFSYDLSILKSNHGDPASCSRFTFNYEHPFAGEGHFIHTYQKDGNPLPSYEGEPTPVAISGDIDTFTDELWNALDGDNKVSLFVRYIDLETGSCQTRIVNKHTK